MDIFIKKISSLEQPQLILLPGLKYWNLIAIIVFCRL